MVRGIRSVSLRFFRCQLDSLCCVHDALEVIAVELVKTVRANVSVDWTIKETVRANLRRLVRRTLKKYGYPPDLEEAAVQAILAQAEQLADIWTAK